MTIFLAGLMVLASVAVVCWPLVRGVGGRRLVLSEDTQVSELLAQKDATLLAISELESDYSMGNLSKSDYQQLRQKYEEKAVALIKTVDELHAEHGLANPMDDAIEARVLALRARDTIGTDIEAQLSKPLGSRPERARSNGRYCTGCGTALATADNFCSRCGTPAALRCPGCSETIEPGDRFCPNCGKALGNSGGRSRT